MDIGLLDDVRDRRAITSSERECFYQLLAAVARIEPGAISRQADAQLAQMREEIPAKFKDLAGNPQAQGNAQRELRKAEQGANDVVPLFNHAEEQRGKLLVLRGNARRAIEVKVEDPDIMHHFGIHKYYEMQNYHDNYANQSDRILRRLATSGHAAG